jgi:hypothetical protein
MREYVVTAAVVAATALGSTNDPLKVLPEFKYDS